jgi:hypothetical protein
MARRSIRGHDEVSFLADSLCASVIGYRHDQMVRPRLERLHREQFRDRQLGRSRTLRGRQVFRKIETRLVCIDSANFVVDGRIGSRGSIRLEVVDLKWIRGRSPAFPRR